MLYISTDTQTLYITSKEETTSVHIWSKRIETAIHFPETLEPLIQQLVFEGIRISGVPL